MRGPIRLSALPVLLAVALGGPLPGLQRSRAPQR